MAGYIGTKASVVTPGAERKKVFSITTTTTSLTGLVYTPGFVHVFHNGVRLVDGTDYTATNGTSITLTTAAQNGDEVVVISYATFQVADAYTKAESDARYANVTGDTFTGPVEFDTTGHILLPKGTTAERPASPVEGMLRFNTTEGADEIYLGGTWQKADRIGEISATGGTITTRDGYKYHKFTSSGTFTVSSGAVIADVLIVAGGGGGSNGDDGNDAGGGGGGGGVYLAERISLTSGSYSVTVGAGGAGVSGTFRVFGNSGSNSSFGALTTAIGGGGGGRCNANGLNGGSGGGAGGGGGGPFIGGTGTENQGFGGGTNHGFAPYTGAGGGGAGGSGGWSGAGRLGGDGGPGAWLWGSSYGGGGGGGGGIGGTGFFATMSHGSGGGAGAGDGGQVDSTNAAGEGRPALANTGSGGGGSGNKSTVGGAGGSGIVIVRYRV